MSAAKAGGTADRTGQSTRRAVGELSFRRSLSELRFAGLGNLPKQGGNLPGDGNPPPGYAGPTAASSWGYDALPAYHYGQTVNACDAAQANNPTPWINLDETDEIGLASMYAGVVSDNSSPGNSVPKLIRFLAKANRTQYVYVAGNSDPNNFAQQWWSQIPISVINAAKTYLSTNKASPPLSL